MPVCGPYPGPLFPTTGEFNKIFGRPWDIPRFTVETSSLWSRFPTAIWYCNNGTTSARLSGSRPYRSRGFVSQISHFPTAVWYCVYGTTSAIPWNFCGYSRNFCMSRFLIENFPLPYSSSVLCSQYDLGDPFLNTYVSWITRVLQEISMNFDEWRKLILSPRGTFFNRFIFHSHI